MDIDLQGLFFVGVSRLIEPIERHLNSGLLGCGEGDHFKNNKSREYNKGTATQSCLKKYFLLCTYRLQGKDTRVVVDLESEPDPVGEPREFPFFLFREGW